MPLVACGLPSLPLQVGGETLDGAAYFVIRPNWKAGTLSASLFREGYGAVAGNNLLYPAIGVSDSGNGAIVFTLSGPSYFPSAAYVPISKLTGTASAVRLAAAGVLPDEGFTVYPPYSDGVGRWGDYSAAVAVADDSVWIATEYIGPKKRDTFTNWGTFIGVLPLPDTDESNMKGVGPNRTAPFLIVFPTAAGGSSPH